MKFIKGMVMGGLISAGAMMMHNENSGMINKKKLMKKGKQLAKKMGIM